MDNMMTKTAAAVTPGTTVHVTKTPLGIDTTRTTGMIFEHGHWLCLTLSAVATRKTAKGAAAWLATRGYAPDGSRLSTP